MKKIGILLAIAFIIVIGLILFYQMNLGPVDKKNDTLIVIEIEPGTTMNKTIDILKENKLIKNKLIFKIYQKIHNNTVQAGTYHFKKTYSAIELASMLDNGNVYQDVSRVTFVEGKNFRYTTTMYETHFDFSSNDILNTISDQEYLKELIDKYWFLENNILNQDIYYSLEGYLFPDTYTIPNNSTIKDVIKIQLDNFSVRISPLKDQIKESGFSIHELITLASIVEQEAKTTTDRKLVAGIFINRLNKKMSLGSDVTTYYAEKVDFGEVRDLLDIQYKEKNAYNTRNLEFIGLPVGPICNPGLDSIKAVLDYTKSDYLYFYADGDGNLLYGKTEVEHQSNINK